MKGHTLLVGLSVLCGLASCTAKHTTRQTASDDKRYASLAAKYIDGYFGAKRFKSR